MFSVIVVLNLVINGIPSILSKAQVDMFKSECFKPCYKWNTFNTKIALFGTFIMGVLNLVINGIPSILNEESS